jgi:hypothetical protein
VIRGALPVIVALASIAGTEATAASFTLDETARREAVSVGERSTLLEGFDREWQVTGEAGTSLTVLTPFHRLAVAARHAAFRNDPLKATEIDRVLKQDAQRLVVRVVLRGPAEDFARHYVPRLVDGPREIKASFVQNERTATRQEDGTYVARCLYGFPVRDVDARGRLALVVADADGRDVRRFTIDLSTMR